MVVRRSALVLSFLVVLFLVACGGSTTDSSGSGGIGRADAGGDPEAGSGCVVAKLPGNTACVPGTARANTPIEIDVAASEGCLGCFTTFDACQVTVDDKTITVSMVTKACKPPGDTACPAVCGLPSTKCTLPGLPEGTYGLIVTGDSPTSGLPPRQLVVTADTSATACALPPPGAPPTAFDSSALSRACSTDDDCVAVTTPRCSPCSCPDLAIAKSGRATYDAAFRAIVSHCPRSDNGGACGPCEEPLTSCSTQPGTKGTCVMGVANPK